MTHLPTAASLRMEHARFTAPLIDRQVLKGIRVPSAAWLSLVHAA